MKGWRGNSALGWCRHAKEDNKIDVAPQYLARMEFPRNSETMSITETKKKYSQKSDMRNITQR